VTRAVLGLIAALAVAAAQGASPPAGHRLRIVSLAPNLTELAYAAGAGDALVGTVEYSDYPAAAKALPRVGDAWRVDVEQVLALRPDLVLAWASGTPEETIGRLRSMRLRVVAVKTFSIADVAAALRQLGAIAGTGAVAEVAARRYEGEMRELRLAHAGVRRLSVFIEIDDEPLYTVNGNHVISEVVSLCGGDNVFADLPQLAPQVALEAVLARDPEVILSTDDTVRDPTELWRPWTRMRAIRAGTIFALDSDTVTRATPRLAEGARAVCAALDTARNK
jgi:iron complex transport system substrate-binding protein